MTSVSSRITKAGMAASVAMLVSMSPISAQPGPGGGMGGWGPGMMMGPGMMGPGSMWGGGMCSPRAAGLAEWRMARIEERVKLTDEQRPKLNALREASAKAAKVITAACPPKIPQSPVERLELMEKRLNAMLEAVKVVRPAFDEFYKALTSDQQARLSVAGPRRWGWRGWRWRQQEQN
jgi:hypothetical protein